MTGKLPSRWRVRFVSLALPVVLFALLGCARGPCVSIVAPDGTTRATVAVEVANTVEQRERGLMFRKHLDKDAGMIFVFPDPEPLSFWMHNTDIPLDMIFADSQFRVIGIVANAAPHTDTLRNVEGSSQYVLEVNGGFCAKHGIRAGDRFDFQNLFPHASE
ncbi:MAG TPA: DUF192 domain-containing protein [Patescibacteria group bacterium]|nr:DUF192 domain-containing protein [Patescibacteria group bacterium]